MVYDELYKKIEGLWHDSFKSSEMAALWNVIKLHMPTPEGRYPNLLCQGCSMIEVNLYANYPCPTIQIIEKELG